MTILVPDNKLNQMDKNKSNSSSQASLEGEKTVMEEQQRKLVEKYGSIPPKKSVLGHRLKERKYFDSGDYAMSKAGKAAPTSVGSAHPTPESIPHSHPQSPPHLAHGGTGATPGTNLSTSPAKESSLLKELPSFPPQ
jgi:hypothetical protein